MRAGTRCVNSRPHDLTRIVDVAPFGDVPPRIWAQEVHQGVLVPLCHKKVSPMTYPKLLML